MLDTEFYIRFVSCVCLLPFFSFEWQKAVWYNEADITLFAFNPGVVMCTHEVSLYDI